MKQMIRLLLILVVVGLVGQEARAGSVTNVTPQAGDWLKKAYLAVVEAELARADHYPVDAAKSYREALGYYERLKTDYPGWQTPMISMRVAECRSALTELEMPQEPALAPEKPGDPAQEAVNNAEHLQNLLKELREVQAALAQVKFLEDETQSRQLLADRARLQEELNEAAKSSQVLQRKLVKLEAKLSKSGAGPGTNTACRAVVSAVKSEANRLMKTNAVASAILLLTEAIELIPTEADLVVLLAVADCRNGQFDQAVKLMAPFDVWRAKNANALLTLGTAYMGLGEIGKARDAIEKALSIKPDFAEAHYNLAQILITISAPDVARSQEHYQRAVELGLPVDLEFENALRAAMIMQKMKKKARPERTRSPRSTQSEVITPGAKTDIP